MLKSSNLTPSKRASSRILLLKVSFICPYFLIFVIGLYEVDIGFDGQDQGDFMAFADVNADKYTDILTVMDQSNEIQFHLYDPFY